MSDDSGDDDKKVIKFPGGKEIKPEEIGADYLIKSTGNVPTPEILDPVSIDQEYRDRTNFVKNQDLVKVVEKGAPTSETIDIVLKEIAEELSHIKFERRKAAKEGKPTTQFTIGRINSLRSLAELLLKRKESALAEQLDLKSPRFQAVFKVWMEFFYESMEKVGVESEVIDLVFQQMKTDMVDWERRMDGAGVE